MMQHEIILDVIDRYDSRENKSRVPIIHEPVNEGVVGANWVTVISRHPGEVASYILLALIQLLMLYIFTI